MTTSMVEHKNFFSPNSNYDRQPEVLLLQPELRVKRPELRLRMPECVGRGLISGPFPGSERSILLPYAQGCKVKFYSAAERYMKREWGRIATMRYAGLA